MVYNDSYEMTEKRKPGYNSRFAKAGVSCFYDSEVQNSSFAHPMRFSAKNPRLRKAATRYTTPLNATAHSSTFGFPTVQTQRSKTKRA